MAEISVAGDRSVVLAGDGVHQTGPGGQLADRIGQLDIVVLPNEVAAFAIGIDVDASDSRLTLPAFKRFEYGVQVVFTSPLYVSEFNIKLRIRNNGCNDACRRNRH